MYSTYIYSDVVIHHIDAVPGTPTSRPLPTAATVGVHGQQNVPLMHPPARALKYTLQPAAEAVHGEEEVSPLISPGLQIPMHTIPAPAPPHPIVPLQLNGGDPATVNGLIQDMRVASRAQTVWYETQTELLKLQIEYYKILLTK